MSALARLSTKQKVLLGVGIYSTDRETREFIAQHL